MVNTINIFKIIINLTHIGAKSGFGTIVFISDPGPSGAAPKYVLNSVYNLRHIVFAACRHISVDGAAVCRG